MHCADRVKVALRRDDRRHLGGQPAPRFGALAPFQLLGEQFGKMLSRCPTLDINDMWRKTAQLIPDDHVGCRPCDDFLRAKPGHGFLRDVTEAEAVSVAK